MRYEEFGWPLGGWTYDERGTIYTTSGYRCSARTLECALWLFQCYGFEARRHLIHSDEAFGALRPLYELSDLSDRTAPTRLRLVTESAGRSQHPFDWRRSRKKSRSSVADSSASNPPCTSTR